MPKSKKRKMKHTPRRKAVQKPLATTTKSVEHTTATTESATPIETATNAPKIKARNITAKTQVIPQISNVATDLKTIGVITVILLAIIVILYFVFR